MLSCLVITVAVVPILNVAVLAVPSFNFSIPNGNNIPHPCNTSLTWLDVINETPNNGGALNPFGADLSRARKLWNNRLCRMDSDGDGKTNGEELGDPKCEWFEEADNDILVTDRAKLSHPGICEPIDSATCRERNKFLANLTECAGKMINTKWCDALAPNVAPRSQLVTFRMERLKVNPQDTKVVCRQFSLPSDEDYIISAFEPIVWTLDAVQQITILACENSSSNGTSYIRPKSCPILPSGCESVALAWTRNSSSRCYDRNPMTLPTGIAFGKNSFSTILLQIRYFNPRRSTIVDASGIAIHYRKVPSRPTLQSVGNILVGQQDIALPPLMPVRNIGSSGFRGKCSKQLLGNRTETYQILSVMLRLNSAGVVGKVSIQKQNMSSSDVLFETTIASNRSLAVLFNSGVNLEPGDAIAVECRYTSRTRQDWTFWGASDLAETCYAVLEVSPSPAGKTSITAFDSGKYDPCLISDETSLIGGCSKRAFQMAKFDSAQLEEACSCSNVYPVPVCTQECFKFLNESGLISASNLITNCFTDDSVFLTLNLYEDASLAYQIQSHVTNCLKSKKPLAASQVSPCAVQNNAVENNGEDYREDVETSTVKTTISSIQEEQDYESGGKAGVPKGSASSLPAMPFAFYLVSFAVLFK